MLGAVLGLSAVALLAVTPHPARATGAAGPNTVLILSTTVTGGASSREANDAVSLGYTVEVVDASGWSAKSAADFSTYKAVILGDPTCSTTLSSVAAAQANTAVWGPAVTGNVIIIGSDPVFHAPSRSGAAQLVQSGIEFAAAGASTGAYVSLSCYYASASPGTPVPLLDAFNGGGFTARAADVDSAHLVTSQPALTGINDASLANWGNSIHEAFDTWNPAFTVFAIAEGLGSSYTAPDATVGSPYILVRTSTCGDGVTDAGEQCDEGGANGTSGSCCNSDCTFRSAGDVCRAGSGMPNGGSVCDPDEVCTGSSGSCPADVVSSGGTVCRAGSGSPNGGAVCDPDEVCSGVPGDPCPTDVITSGGSVCRGGSGNPNGGSVCDPDEVCSGNPGDPCPADSVASTGTVCRAGSGNPNGGAVCDPDEVCSGNPGDACPADTVDPGGTVCRAGSGNPNGGAVCDPDEACSGTPGAPCPADTVASSGTICRSGSGNPNGGAVCDPDETCSGTAGAPCPADAVQPSSFACRAAAGVCDVAENCSGTPGQPCAADAFKPASTVCRPVANDCDVAENCTGGTAACPSDGFKPDGSACNDNNICTETDSCTNGVCAGSPTGADTDGDGYCDLFENQVGCDPNDPQEIPPQAPTYGGKGANRANVLVTYSGPSTTQITPTSDTSCTSSGACGSPPPGFPKGFCSEGRIGDACTTDAQCNLPPGTCRLVVNYADVPDLVLDYAVLNRHANAIAGFTPVHPGCSRKVDVTLDPSRPINRIRVKAEGTVAGHHGKDRDIFIYR
jgi:hypothetical protein